MSFDLWVYGFRLERPNEPSRTDTQKLHRWRPKSWPLMVVSGGAKVVTDPYGVVENLLETHTNRIVHTLSTYI